MQDLRGPVGPMAGGFAGIAIAIAGSVGRSAIAVIRAGVAAQE